MTPNKCFRTGQNDHIFRFAQVFAGFISRCFLTNSYSGRRRFSTGITFDFRVIPAYSGHKSLILKLFRFSGIPAPENRNKEKNRLQVIDFKLIPVFRFSALTGKGIKNLSHKVRKRGAA